MGAVFVDGGADCGAGMTQIVIRVDGYEYKSVAGDEQTAEAVAEQFYSFASDVDRLKLSLEGGSWLVLPKESVRRATFLILATPAETQP